MTSCSLVRGPAMAVLFGVEFSAWRIPANVSIGLAGVTAKKE